MLRFVNQISWCELEVQVVFFEIALLGKDQFQSNFHQIYFHVLQKFKDCRETNVSKLIF